MTKPPAGAGDVMSTVAVDAFPPTTVDGFRDRRVMFGAVSVTVAVFETPSKVAVIVTLVLLVTATVVISAVAVV
jgi:hypothetical protein